ncbi:hydrogenase assembly chaperone hypC/hupF [Ferroglobus placidus DSM 10642]|uniref:Hydrogenase assembly chaperone hypC/hupF n=1 Tax=Ferroglobus placidus (strain DSM 10642 / AEDII12DO) TaxID=589924 RepID=D3RZN5_FERPA|nr:HypC/HybG/HupF family hydrogenase formation chaperone [Ferroglobus placidus]ADC65948.1 hydrogenase assembly chaperone hypC/hupF [Ferroglobus placidus DSM 10642]
MCLAIPAKVLEIDYPFATVSLGGAKRKVRVDLLEEVKPGDYVLVHVGLAIQKVSEEEVREIERLWEELLRE